MTKRLLSGLLLLLLLGYAAWILHREIQLNRTASGRVLGRPLFPTLDINQVARVVIRSRQEFVELNRSQDRWLVPAESSYPADFEQLRNLSRALREARILLSRSVRPEDWAKLELQDPSGSLEGAGLAIELYSERGTLLAKLLLGRMHPNRADPNFTDGRYVRIPGETEVYVIREPFTTAFPTPRQWLDPTFPRTSSLRRIALRRADKLEWELCRDQAQSLLKLTNDPDNRLDPERVSQLEHAVAYGRFNSVRKAEGEVAAGAEILELESFEGPLYHLTLAPSPAEGVFPVRVSVSSREGADPAVARREQEHYRGWEYLMPQSFVLPIPRTREKLLRTQATPTPVPTRPSPKETTPETLQDTPKGF